MIVAGIRGLPVEGLRWLGSGCILTIEPAELADGLFEECEKIRGIEMPLKILTQAIGRMELSLGKIV